MEDFKNIIVALDVPSPDAVEIPVLKVFDGDGFLTRLDVPGAGLRADGRSKPEAVVRFGFIDAPEIDQPGGPEAREFLTFLIGGKTVWIDILIKSDTGKIVDRYGRVVCVPYIMQDYSRCILKTRRGHYHLSYQFGQPINVARNIELEMVLNGWAWVIERYGPDDRYIEALEDARANKRGIWARDDNEPPWRFKQRRARERGRTGGRGAAPVEQCCDKARRGPSAKQRDLFDPVLICSCPGCTCDT